MKSPFKFLDAFTLKDKDSFFGRDQEIDALYSIVFKTPMLLVYGLSGTGKTSLIQCGLANRFDGPDWYPVFIRRNNNINTSTATVMRNALGNLAKDNLADNVSVLLRKTLRPVYLLFDQFEELFILGKEEEQKQFMNSLRELLDAQLPSKIVLIMREEYIGQLYAYETLIPELFDHRFRVEPMGPNKVKNVISSSFTKFNIHLAEPKDELLDLMVHNISDPRSGITLPYLQVYLDMLYRDKYRKQYGQSEAEGYPKMDITKADIQSIGRIDNVLERFLEDQTRELRVQLVQKYKTVKPTIIQDVLDVFVSEEGTKRPVTYKQSGNDIILAEEAVSTLKDISLPMLTEILNTLQNDRILRRTDDSFELAHDSLALVIDGRRSQSQKQLQNIRKRLINAHEEYQKTGAFLNQKQLAAFDDYRAQLGLSAEMEKFLDKCEEEVIRQAAEDKDRLQQETRMAQQKKLARTRKTWLVVAIILAGLALSMASISLYNNRNLKKVNKEFKEYGDQMDIQFFKTKNDLDSLKNVILQVNSLLPRLDTMVRSEQPVNRIKLLQVVMSLKSTIGSDTLLSEAQKAKMLEMYISMDSSDMFFTSSIKPSEAKAKRETAFISKVVYVVLRVKTPKPLGDIEVKWLNENGEILGDPVYKTVDKKKSDKDGLQWLSFSTVIDDPGNYRVKVTNGSGLEIGSKSFSRIEAAGTVIQGENPNAGNTPVQNPTSENNTNTGALSVLEFRTMSSGSLNAPGPKKTAFKVGEMIHYYSRLNSPVAGVSIRVQLVDDKGKEVWVDKFVTAVNTSEKGFRLWKFHGARAPGSYTVRLVDQNGGQLAAESITIE